MSDLKNISVAAKKAHWKDGPSTRAKKRRGGQNVMWRRITDAFDDHLKKFGANPAMVAPITRWVLFEHLTKTQGMAGRRYADIVRNFDKYHVTPPNRTAGSANLEPTTLSGRLSSDDTIEKHLRRGTIHEYEERAAYARRQHKRLMNLLAKYVDPITGRNQAKEYLDQLCLEDKEPPAEARKDIAAVLTAVAKEFGLGKKPPKIKSWRSK